MTSLYYKEYGKGPALVLLHGFCETHEIWDTVITGLSNQFRVICIDLPGFGKSQILDGHFTIKDVGLSVIELIQTLNIKRCILVGHSLGGYVALAAAEGKSEFIDGLCLFHSTALPDNEEKKINRNRVMEFVDKNGVPPFIETFVPGLFFQKVQKNLEKVAKIALTTSKKTLMAYTQAMRDRPDMSGFLKEFTRPVLFLAGAQDTIIPLSTLSDQTKFSKNGSLKVLLETGHMGMFEDTNEAIHILMDFAKACFNPGKP